MKNNILVLLLIFLPHLTFAQEDSVFIDSVLMASNELFEQSKEIKLIELRPYCSIQQRPIGLFGRIKDVEVCYSLPVIHCLSDSTGYTCKIDTSHFGKDVLLAKAEVDTLFNVLYKSKKIDWRAACYNPRHGIAFYADDGSLIGFLEICFECSQIMAEPTTPFSGTPDEWGLLRLKALFYRSGLIID